MSSKDSILASIRRHTGARHEMPELTLEAITYADKLATFSEVLAGAGGKAIELKPGEDVNEVIRREFPEAKRIASNLKEITCATFNPDELTDPRELNGTDVSVVEGSFGVAENAAVWLPRQVRYKGLYFISNALVILLDKTQLVHTMNEAYRRTATMDYDYGVFMSGPSKTAVVGAHGPIHVVVLLRYNIYHFEGMRRGTPRLYKLYVIYSSPIFPVPRYPLHSSPPRRRRFVH